MGFLDRYRKTPKNFADGTSLQRMPAGGGSEVGVAGESIIAGFEGEEQRTDKYSIADYVRMRQTDGTVASLHLILTMPIVASNYTIDQDEDDANSEQADFVRSALFDPPHKGGMETPFGIFLSQMSQAVLEGFSLHEKVYALRDGKIVYKKLASRAATTVVLRRADDGGYGGAHQRTTFQGTSVDVEIPADKTFLYTYGKDKNYLYGESAFKAAGYHHDKKHKLYYLANLKIQTEAVPPKVLSGASNVSKEDKAAAMSAAKQLGGTRTVGYFPDTIKLDPYMGASASTDPITLIDHHDTQMARSVLAQFLMLGGTQGSKGGSFALSKDHSDILMIALKAVMKSMEDHINFYLIPDLVDMNFANPAYPEFHFEDITSDTKDIIVAAFTQLATTGQLSPELKQGIEDRVAETLDVDTDAIKKEIEAEAPDDPEKTPDPTQPAPEAGADPKASASATGAGSGPSPRRRSAFSLLR